MTYEELNAEIKKINNAIKELNEARCEFQKKKDEIFRKEAVEHVGRCFRHGDEYVKIIGVPDDDEWNKYYFSTICLHSSDECEMLPFMSCYDNLDILNSNYTEISQDEFNAEFKRLVDIFRNKIITIGDKTCLTCRMYNNPSDFLCTSCGKEYSNYEPVEEETT